MGGRPKVWKKGSGNGRMERDDGRALSPGNYDFRTFIE